MARVMKSERKIYDLQKDPLCSYGLKSLSIAGKNSPKKKFGREPAYLRSAIKKDKAIKKWKSSEINKGLKNAKSISKVSHSHFGVSVAKPKKSFCLKKIPTDPNIVQQNSKTSIGARKKQAEKQGFMNHKLEKMPPLKAIHVAKPKLHFNKKIDEKVHAFRMQREKIPPLKAIHVAKPKLHFNKKIDEKGHAFRMLREKDKWTNGCKKEKSSNKSNIKAVEYVTRRAKNEPKMKIKKQREASRLALEKMEATAMFEDFNQVLKEMKELDCQNISFYVLRELGLFLKEDGFDEYDISHFPIQTNDGLDGEGDIFFYEEYSISHFPIQANDGLDEGDICIYNSSDLCSFDFYFK